MIFVAPNNNQNQPKKERKEVNVDKKPNKAAEILLSLYCFFIFFNRLLLFVKRKTFHCDYIVITFTTC